MARVQQFNRDVRGWTAGTKRKMKLEITRMTAVYSGHARKDLSARVRNYLGEASKILWGFPYYMVFVHKGAGRGYGGSITGKFTKSDGSKGLTRRSSFGKMGTGRRRPKPWFNPVIEQRFPELAEILAAYHAGKVVANIERILVR